MHAANEARICRPLDSKTGSFWALWNRNMSLHSEHLN